MGHQPRYESSKRLLEELRAEQVLADMDCYADLAELHDTETCADLRKEFAERYVRWIGVHPAQREQLRTALTELVERLRSDVGALVTVTTTIERVRREHQTIGSGLGGVDESPTELPNAF